ncbi:hypothetical protein EVAR_100803_1 [Eumeta japonica]|uniref:Uncharacterized protein n=1 Tax=Eumeta variegata TaxID=151549 RepID=A0A4C2A348_EUMVA|nr:hypothetical protein EVAR_100803_1 [Eumeta japonica]
MSSPSSGILVNNKDDRQERCHTKRIRPTDSFATSIAEVPTPGSGGLRDQRCRGLGARAYEHQIGWIGIVACAAYPALSRRHLPHYEVAAAGSLGEGALATGRLVVGYHHAVLHLRIS